MSSTTILSVIQHYQKSIEHSQDDEGRLLHCINKLYRLPVKVEHLQETGVGKTVNSLRKYNGEIGVAAKALVTKWKAMVAAEEEPIEGNDCENNDDGNDDDGDGNNGNDNGSSADDHYDTNSNNNHNKKSSTVNVTNDNTSKGHQSSNRSHSKKSGSEHLKEKSNSHSSSKHKRRTEHEENDIPNEKRIKNDEHDNEKKKRDSHKHKTSHEKTDRQHEQSSSKDAKSTSSKQTSHHNRNSDGDNDTKEKKHRDEKRSEHASASKHQSNDNEEVATRKHGENEKNRSSSKEKDRKEKSKEAKHDKTKSSSKDSSQRDKHHKSSTSHSSHSNKPSTTTEQPTSSSSNTKPDSTSDGGSSSKRKRQHDSDSNDASSPSKTKAAKTSKSPKLKVTTPTNGNENEVEDDDGIDSSMGANFADVLGMLMMPTKKSKKLLSNNKSPTASTPSRNTEKPSSNNSAANKDNKNEYKPSSISSSSSSLKPIDTKPEALSSSTKLAPLDPSIALELPTISANYKPLPHNKTVMDCIYPNSGIISNTPKPFVRTLTDAEAISHGISSKTMRTKIYSGIRTGQMLQVPSLFDLCIRILQKNIDALEYTGGVPFDVLRPVLERATPQQLLTFEEYNPYLMEDSDCLWQIHVQRSFRAKKREEMESWREMFLRCEDEKERKLSSLTETIKKSQKIIAAPIRKTQLAFVDSMVKPPRNVIRKQEQYGTKEKVVATPAARVAALSNVTPNAGKLGDTRLRVATTVRDTAQVVANPARGKKAPLMAKTLQFIKGRHKR